MAFLVKNECKNLLLIEKLVVPEACDISPQIIQVQAGFTWPYCRVFEVFLKTFNKSSIYFAIFWSNFKIFPLAFEVSKPKKNVQKCKIQELHTFLSTNLFFPFSYEFFFFTFGGLYLTKFGNLDFQSSLVVSTDPSLDL